MSINGSVASFLPFTINGLTDASFSNSVLGNAIATTLQVTSATPLKFARFNADRELVSASVDESQVALLVGGNVFNGVQTILPGSITNINNVITTAITAEAFGAGSFTTSGISGYTAPLGTITGPVSGEYSIGQTANDRTIMRVNGFTPTARAWTYTFTIRCVDVTEAYLSVEQSGVQRSSAIRQFTAEDTVVSDTFTYDPTSGPIVFKIYSGSLDPWNATWSSFTLGYYNVAITAPLSAPLVATAISTTTIGTEILSFPSISSINSESWSVYAISTMGNLSTLGGLVIQETTSGNSVYLTGGVVGAPNFQFTTLGTNGKVVVTDGNRVMSTTISAGQLDYITALTSQAGGVGQGNTWTGTNDFTTLTSVAALRITSSASNVDYSVSVNGTDYLEFTNLLSLQKVYTDGDSFWIPNRIFCNSTIYTSDLQMGSAIYFAYGTGQQWGTTLNGSGEYVIQDDVGGTRLKLSKSTGLTVSTINVTSVPSATPTFALGVNGSGGMVSFAVPTPAVNLLPLNNTWTGTNTFQSTVSILDTTTTSIAGYTTAILQIAGITAAASQPATITGSFLLTPNPTTSPFASCYSPTQNFITGAQYRFLFTGFSYGIFGMSLTMFQANVANSASVAISASFPFTSGTFTGAFTPNVNPAFLGQVFLFFQGTANKTFSWTGFAYEVGSQKTTGAFEVNGIANINGGTNFAVLNNYMQTGSLTIGDYTRNYGGGTTTWNSNTAGLMMECLDNTEIAVHDAGLRVASLMYYDGPANTIRLGRDMGWATSDVATASKLTVQDVIRFGNYSGGNYDNIQFMRGTGTGQYPNIRCQNNYIAMYVSDVGGWMTGSQIGDMVFLGEAGRNLRFGIGGQQALLIDSSNNVSLSGSLTMAITQRIYLYYISGVNNAGIVCEGSGDMVFFTGTSGTGTRLRIAAGGDITASNNLYANCLIINGGGTYQAGCIYSDANWGMLFRAKVVPAQGIFGWYDANGTERMKMLTDASMSHTAGDNSVMKYGPNGTWNAYLSVGSGTDKSGVVTAQVLSTNGNLHLDAGNGLDMYYGYYPYSRGTPNTHHFYGSVIFFASGLPQQTTTAIAPLCFNGSQLFRSANINNVVYSNNSVAWTGGVYVVNGFYRTNAYVSTLIHGKLSYYVGGVGWAYPWLRIHHPPTGQYWDYNLQAYLNVAYSHTTFPFSVIFNSNNTLTTGWYDVQVFNNGNCLSDAGDQLWILANTAMSNQFV